MKQILIVVALVCLAGCSSSENREARVRALPQMYRELGQTCLSKVNFNCCMASVETMAEVRGALYEPGKACPAGRRKETLKCRDSYTWCGRLPEEGENEASDE